MFMKIFFLVHLCVHVYVSHFSFNLSLYIFSQALFMILFFPVFVCSVSSIFYFWPILSFILVLVMNTYLILCFFTLCKTFHMHPYPSTIKWNFVFLYVLVFWHKHMFILVELYALCLFASECWMSLCEIVWCFLSFITQLYIHLCQAKNVLLYLLCL